METAHIREFIVLAETCSFQDAAEALFISLSSLSKHIRAIEEELDAPLFDRTTRRVKLNENGALFYEYARKIINLCDDYSDALSELRQSDDKRLSVGFMPRLEQCGIMELLSDFQQKHPDILMKMTSRANTGELLKERKCNFVFDTDNGMPRRGIRKIFYRSDDLVAMFPLDHPLAKEQQINVSQLRGQKFIMHNDSYGDAFGGYHDYRKLCLSAGFEPTIIMTASFTASIVKLVNQGRGIAIMNRMFVPAAILSRVAIVDISPKVSISVYMMYPDNTKLTAAEADFIKFITSEQANTALKADYRL